MSNDPFRFMKAFSMLSDMETSGEDLATRVKAKERIFRATWENTPGLIWPENWDELSDEEKMKRMKKVEDME